MGVKKEPTVLEEEVLEEGMSVAEHMNERVPYEAFLDEERYKDDINMTINGKTWQIQRGVQVMIPRFVKKAIEDADAQKRIATMTSLGHEQKFRNLADRGIL